MHKGSWLWRAASQRVTAALYNGQQGSANGEWRCDTGPGGCHVCIETLRAELRAIADMLDVSSEEIYRWCDPNTGETPAEDED